MTLCGDILAGKQARKQKSLFWEAPGASGTMFFLGRLWGALSLWVLLRASVRLWELLEVFGRLGSLSDRVGEPQGADGTL